MALRMPRVAPEHEFSRPRRVTVPSHDDKIGLGIRCVRQDGVGDIDIARDNLLELDLETMASEVVGDIGARNLVALARLARDKHDLDGLCAGKEWHGVACCARGAAAAVPAHHDAVEL